MNHPSRATRGRPTVPPAAARVGGFVLALGLLALAACSSKGGGPSQGAAAPTAIATPIGYKATSAPGADPVTITVRSGADVQLSGGDSFDGNVGITTFVWQRTDTAATQPIALIYRNASTISFTAPAVASDTTLSFQLTVTNAIGAGSAHVQVLVKPANDPNRFLSLLATPHHFRAALSLTGPGVTSGSALALAADIPVCVSLSAQIRYLNRNGTMSSFALPGQQVETKWLAAAGAMAGFPSSPPPYLAFRNPVVSFDLPVLNDDLIFAAYNEPGASETEIGEELVASDIDQAYVPMSVSAVPGTCASPAAGSLGGLQLMLQLQDESGTYAVGPTATGAVNGDVTVSTGSLPLPDPLTPPSSGSTALTPDDFLRAAQVGSGGAAIETRESAAAYYLAVDPSSAKTTLPNWLSKNCFDPNSATLGAGESAYNVVHATYTNNYDLGFGRDMYFATCANGNMASVVINYPSLDAAANRIGAFLAVAMEYAPASDDSSAACFGSAADDAATNTGKCFAKFYAFAPDDRSGVFQRVQTVDFDRRGQKYLPGACTVCHGGSPSYTPGATPNAAYSSGLRGAGDLDAAFLPWDLSSLLFSDTDPDFSCTVSSVSPNCTSINPANYTQAAQAPNIQRLNALTWRTYDIYSAEGQKDIIPGQAGVTGDAPCVVPGAPQEPCVLRFQGGVDLLTKWYGGNPGASTAHAFDDSTTPSSWPDAQAAPNDPYHSVFAHYCRSCHTQSNIPFLQFSSGLPAGELAPTTALTTVPESVQLLAFGTAQMPLSRLTTDRFWADFAGGQSAAQTLAVYIDGLAKSSSKIAPVALDAAGNVIPPGAPILRPLESSNLLGSMQSWNALTANAPNALSRFQGARIDALTQSLFISSYQWTLCDSATSDCAADPLDLIGTPVVPAGSSAGPAQSGASLPALPTRAAGTFYLTLTANSAIAGQSPLILTYPLAVSASDPVLAGCPTSMANFDGQQIPIDVSACFTQLGDPPFALQLSYDGVTYGATAGAASLAWQASVVPASGPLDPKTGFPQAGPAIQFNFTPNAAGDAVLYFKWCDGNTDASSCASGTVPVALLTGLSATPASFLGYWNPAANASYGGVFTPPPSGLAMQPSLSLSALNAAISVDAPAATLTLTAPSDGGSLSGSTLVGSASGLAAQVNTLTYAPCGNFVTQDINGNDVTSSIRLLQLEPPCAIPLAGGVTFAYSLSDVSQSQSSVGTINIRALSSFQQGASSVNGTLGASCSSSSCHGAPIFWQYDSTSANSTYTSISTGRDSFGAALVKPGQPAQSAFYTAPCLGTDTSGTALQGMSQIFQPGSSECQILYQWMLEGGQND